LRGSPTYPVATVGVRNIKPSFDLESLTRPANKSGRSSVTAAFTGLRLGEAGRVCAGGDARILPARRVVCRYALFFSWAPGQARDDDANDGKVRSGSACSAHGHTKTPVAHARRHAATPAGFPGADALAIWIARRSRRGYRKAPRPPPACRRCAPDTAPNLRHDDDRAHESITEVVGVAGFTRRSSAQDCATCIYAARDDDRAMRRGVSPQ